MKTISRPILRTARGILARHRNRRKHTRTPFLAFHLAAFNAVKKITPLGGAPKCLYGANFEMK
jgi:hypothetical protein